MRRVKLLAFGALLVAAPLFAQSAADKSTARGLAQDGIKAYNVGRYDEALDKLQRAESLYDAPVHLIYIARTQVKKGLYVEAAETYRKLQRVELEAGAPAAFKKAVQDAGPELEAFEAKIPALRIEVQPTATGLELRIDGEKVSAATVGVDRPVNPGAHVVQAWAPGYETSESKIEIKLGEKKSVALVLKAGQSPPPPVNTPNGTPAPVGTSAPPASSSAALPEPEPPTGKLGFMVGLRFAGGVPTGDLYVEPGTNAAQNVSDYFQPGGGFEVHGGVRAFKYFTLALFYERYVLKPGSHYNTAPDSQNDVEVNTTASAQFLGLTLLVGTPRGQLGGFGELSVGLQAFVADSDATYQGQAPCKASDSFTGSALRLGGGATIPIGDWFHLAPYGGVTIGTFDKIEVGGDDACLPNGPVTGDIGQRKTHSVITLGVGGDFNFGGDRARE